jgi:hypothetical protein
MADRVEISHIGRVPCRRDPQSKRSSSWAEQDRLVSSGKHDLEHAEPSPVEPAPASQAPATSKSIALAANCADAIDFRALALRWQLPNRKREVSPPAVPVSGPCCVGAWNPPSFFGKYF